MPRGLVTPIAEETTQSFPRPWKSAHPELENRVGPKQKFRRPVLRGHVHERQKNREALACVVAMVDLRRGRRLRVHELELRQAQVFVQLGRSIIVAAATTTSAAAPTEEVVMNEREQRSGKLRVPVTLRFGETQQVDMKATGRGFDWTRIWVVPPLWFFPPRGGTTLILGSLGCTQGRGSSAAVREPCETRLLLFRAQDVRDEDDPILL